MFLGEFHHMTDAKHRLILPAKFREALGDRFIITKGLDKCLFVYTDTEWQALHDKVKGLPVTDVAVRRFVRFFFGGAAEGAPDAQGRVMLPAHLREYASITKEIVSLGVSNRIEVWSKENWLDYNNTENEIDGDIAEKMALLGI